MGKTKAVPSERLRGWNVLSLQFDHKSLQGKAYVSLVTSSIEELTVGV